MNASTGIFADALGTDLRYRPARRELPGTQMSTGSLRSTWKLRSRSAFCSGYRCPSTLIRLHALTTFNTRVPSRTGKDHEVQPREEPAVMCAVSAIGPTRM